MENTSALAVMLKSPVPGRVKTRLTPELSKEEAAGLYRCFIADIFASVVKLRGVDIYAAYTPKGASGGISGIIPEGVRRFPQSGRGLGERIYSVFKYLFQKGYEKVTVIGSDSPDLPRQYIEEAFSLLDGADCAAVLGPAMDGGYYLVAMDALTGALFKDIPWSTGKVLDKTIKNAIENRLPFKLLKPWHDIDTAEDLELLRDNTGAPASAGFLKAKVAVKEYNKQL